jgi:hypothetical protein
VATIDFDQLAWSTCDLAKAERTQSVMSWRCIAMAPTTRVPVSALACEVASGDSLGLGMPMTRADHDKSDSPIRSVPQGAVIVLGAPGLATEVAQGSRDAKPTFTFRKDAAPIVETDYAARP